MSSSNPNELPKAHSQTPSQRGLQLQHMNLAGTQFSPYQCWSHFTLNLWHRSQTKNEPAVDHRSVFFGEKDNKTLVDKMSIMIEDMWKISRLYIYRQGYIKSVWKYIKKLIGANNALTRSFTIVKWDLFPRCKAGSIFASQSMWCIRSTRENLKATWSFE